MAKWNCFSVAALLVCLLLLAHAIEAARDELASAAGVATETIPSATKTIGAGAGVADKKTFWSSRGGGSGSDCGWLGGRGGGGGGSLGGGVGGIGGIGGGGN